MLAKFDRVMQEHVRVITTNEVHDHYLGQEIQNLMIELIARAANTEIIKSIKSVKVKVEKT
jgi:hypothetical protein